MVVEFSEEVLDATKFDVETNEAALASAKAQLEVRRNERDSVAARLGDQSGASPESEPP
jgi:HlyD family secretion protein